VVHQHCRKQEGYLLDPVHRRGPSHLVDPQVYVHWSLYQLHEYVDPNEFGQYTQLEYLSNADQDMKGKAVRRDAVHVVPLVEENYDNLGMEQ